MEPKEACELVEKYWPVEAKETLDPRHYIEAAEIIKDVIAKEDER